MAVYPFLPLPNSIQAPAVIDPMHVFESDSGVTMRRPKHSRPQRRYQLDYLGKATWEWRIIRDFFQAQRLGVLPFEFVHHTGLDDAFYDNTTPVIVHMYHTFLTGQWILIYNSAPNTSLNAGWQITRLSGIAFSLNGSNAGGAGTCQIRTYLPNAVGIFQEDTDASPVKLIGPESVSTTRGRFSFSVTVEEVL
jgi:hypothetical protein